MQDPARENPPHCFGNPKLWDPKEKECAGGLDPAFTDENGSHIRQKCIFFEACGTRVQASRMEPARSLLDPKSLVRSNVPVLAPASPAPSQTAQFVERFASSIAQQAATHPYNPSAKPIHLPPPGVQQGQPAWGYQQMMAVNYQMPGYLSVPEVRHPGQTFWSLIGRTMLRAIGKSFGHAIAHLFDTVPLGPPPPPGGNVDSPSRG